MRLEYFIIPGIPYNVQIENSVGTVEYPHARKSAFSHFSHAICKNKFSDIIELF